MLSAIFLAFIPLALSSRPNIVFLLADDLGYGDLEDYSVYPAKNSHAKLKTPNLSNLRKQSMMFTDAYCGAPVCAPSRCTLMLGRHSGHCTVRSNGPLLNATDVTVAKVLSDAGYDTAMFGKWGLGENGTAAKNDPHSKGFGTYIGQQNQNYCHNYYPSWQWHNFSKVNIPANSGASVSKCGTDHAKCAWSGDLWTAESIAYLQDDARKQKPFYLFLSLTAPHAGSVGSTAENDVPGPRVSVGPYASKTGQWPKVEVDFATTVYDVDEKIGAVLKTLDETNLTSNTVVFFASDNGAHNEGTHKYTFFASSGPLSGFKRSLKEGGHRTPLLIRWPGVVRAGSKSAYQWTFYDFMATAADIAGVSNKRLPVNDGVSVVATLRGQGQKQKDFVYHEYCAPNEYKQGWGQAVRMGNMTGLCIGNKPTSPSDVPVCTKATFELYDLSTDLEQTKNIASENPNVVDEMLKLMKVEHVYNGYCHDAMKPDPEEQFLTF